jgi:hypothetical protein
MCLTFLVFNACIHLSAEDLQTKGVYMNAVDTGWINDENPLERAAAYAQSAGVLRV